MSEKRKGFEVGVCVTLLAACTGRLNVTTEPIDEHPDGGTDTSGPPREAGALDSARTPASDERAAMQDGASGCNDTVSCGISLLPCDCAISPGLRPIACGINTREATVYLNATGTAAAMTLCDDSLCDAYSWTVSVGLELIKSTTDAKGMSADGTVLVDRSSDDQGRAPFLRRITGETMEIPLAGVAALSEDGMTVVGSLPGVYGQFARWTAERGTVALGDSSKFYDRAPSMTADGAIVVGQRESSTDSGLIRWDASGREIALGALPGSSSQDAFVTALSRDGNVVAVRSAAVDNGRIFRWTNGGGFVALAATPGTAPGARVSADGSLLFGTSVAEEANAVPFAFRWTAGAGLVALEGSPAEGSMLVEIDAAGAIAVGVTLGGATPQPFVWDAVHGIRSLQSILGTNVDLQGWELGAPLALSANGHVIFGEGICHGARAIYRAAIP